MGSVPLQQPEPLLVVPSVRKPFDETTMSVNGPCACGNENGSVTACVLSSPAPRPTVLFGQPAPTCVNCAGPGSVLGVQPAANFRIVYRIGFHF